MWLTYFLFPLIIHTISLQSNRQETSGVLFEPATGGEFNRFLGSATSAHEHGYEEVLKELHAIEKRIYEEEPKLTSNSVAATATPEN